MATEPDETAGSELRAIEVGQTASHITTKLLRQRLSAA